ncbi:MAG: porin family protein, partial [Bacteroidota bacterium]
NRKMKQLSLILVCVTFFAFSGKTQVDLSYWIVKGGLSLPSIPDDSDNGFDLNTRVAYHLGIGKSFPINDYLSLKTELMYSEKGGRWRPEQIFLGVLRPYNVRTSYVTLPVTAQASYDRLYVEVGVEPGYQLNVAVVNENNGFDNDFIERSWTNSYDINGVFGIGFFDDISGFEANIRFMPSFTRASNEISVVDENGQVVDTRRFGRNRVFQISVSYRIRGEK